MTLANGLSGVKVIPRIAWSHYSSFYTEDGTIWLCDQCWDDLPHELGHHLINVVCRALRVHPWLRHRLQRLYDAA